MDSTYDFRDPSSSGGVGEEVRRQPAGEARVLAAFNGHLSLIDEEVLSPGSSLGLHCVPPRQDENAKGMPRFAPGLRPSPPVVAIVECSAIPSYKYMETSQRALVKDTVKSFKRNLGLL